MNRHTAGDRMKHANMTIYPSKNSSIMKHEYEESCTISVEQIFNGTT